jgi:hypothetical protein
MIWRNEEMLPDFPMLKRKIQEMAVEDTQDQIQQDPILSRIRRELLFEGNRSSMKTENGETEESSYKGISAPNSVEREDIINKGHIAFMGNIRDEMIENVRGQQIRQLFDTVEKAAEKSGNVVNGKGQPITFEHFLELFEKIQIDFDEEGNPHGLFFAMHPNTFAKIKDKLLEWENNPEYKKKYEEILEKKRKEYYDRENHRKLVD